jgi:hypothetical protein
MARSLAGFDAVEVPPPSPAVPLSEWTDARGLRAKAAFAAWTARHMPRILRRELGRIAPFVAPELG